MSAGVTSARRRSRTRSTGSCRPSPRRSGARPRRGRPPGRSPARRPPPGRPARRRSCRRTWPRRCRRARRGCTPSDSQTVTGLHAAREVGAGGRGDQQVEVRRWPGRTPRNDLGGEHERAQVEAASPRAVGHPVAVLPDERLERREEQVLGQLGQREPARRSAGTARRSPRGGTSRPSRRGGGRPSAPRRSPGRSAGPTVAGSSVSGPYGAEPGVVPAAAASPARP